MLCWGVDFLVPALDQWMFVSQQLVAFKFVIFILWKFEKSCCLGDISYIDCDN